MVTLEQAVRNRLKEIRARIARGKGTWPQNDYVRDCVWDAGQEHALRMVLKEAGLSDAENHPIGSGAK